MDQAASGELFEQVTVWLRKTDPAETDALQKQLAKLPNLKFNLTNQARLCITGSWSHCEQAKLTLERSVHLLKNGTNSASASSNARNSAQLLRNGTNATSANANANASNSAAHQRNGTNSGNASAQSCAICTDTISDQKTAKILPCNHMLCNDCFAKMQQNNLYKCPFCACVIAEPRGNQPEGTMTDEVISTVLPGFEKDASCKGTILVSYQIPSGTQSSEHPNPGTRFSGTNRHAYLPNNPEGQKVLSLLKRAWNARLIFTIGQSATSGRDNTVVWAGIHHKTSISGGPQNHGYPDDTYLARVTEELAAVGIADEKQPLVGTIIDPEKLSDSTEFPTDKEVPSTESQPLNAIRNVFINICSTVTSLFTKK